MHVLLGFHLTLAHQTDQVQGLVHDKSDVNQHSSEKSTFLQVRKQNHRKCQQTVVSVTLTTFKLPDKAFYTSYGGTLLAS